MVGLWMCQQLWGGHGQIVNQSVDEYGMCRHPECNPEEAQNNTKVILQTSTNTQSAKLLERELDKVAMESRYQ